MIELVVLLEEEERKMILFPCNPTRIWEEGDCLKARKKALTGIPPCRLAVFIAVKNICCLSHPIYGIL
jgi:hypothetical protein